AGNAGRGFAVVAEEVRNLAAKSAEAAQDTEALIENSISRAVLGVKIAGETNESLIEIVDGIVQSSRIAGEIAESADRQYNAIGEINTGIDQVSQVVQQNSATAEESAAASEELSSQSSMLSGLIGQFKLRGATGSGAYLSRAVEEPVPIESVTPRIALDAKSYVESHDKY
ncbi:MAG: methyl-accepting chemotaxis protein, partial [Clostridiales Family XIII bacterium]|nr:methyl-accepting chemotaxis protein [Clostridiales Family XIII bacterium]